MCTHRSVLVYSVSKRIELSTNERTKKWTNKDTNKQTNERAMESANERTNVPKKKGTNEQMNKQDANERRSERVNERTSGRTHKRRNEWTKVGRRKYFPCSLWFFLFFLRSNMNSATQRCKSTWIRLIYMQTSSKALVYQWGSVKLSKNILNDLESNGSE